MQMHVLTTSRRAARMLAIGAAAFACASALAQPAQPRGFSQLVALSAARLDLSRQVALTKWGTGDPVADPPGDPREQEVVAAASREAVSRGLAGNVAAAFFSDQIEASKLVQFALLARWQRTGHAPADRRADLRSELRPALDRLRPLFIDELIATRELREAADCRQQLVGATAVHVETHRLPPLLAIALDRGLARVCGG
ncbi:gamma subclass chorismate mutase AroQ [Variovorax paradoxus]|uniref:gamma subclass chorismate mutase AroQ n=1 Tax=Variovorax paradoxus TaxID=34073 RepID=UPI003D65C06D